MHEIFVDYIVCSIQVSEKNLVLSGAESVSPIPFYKRGYRDSLGKRYYFGHHKTSNAYVVMGGEYMHNSRVVGWSDRDTIRQIIEDDGIIRRMDIAITDYVEEDLITPACIAEMVRAGGVHGAMAEYGAKTISSVVGEKYSSVETTYIGDISKRGKKGVFRAYDKGLEMNMDKYMITRLEIEERGDNAHMSAKRFSEGATLTQIIESRLKFDDERMKRLFLEDAIDVSRGDQIISKTDAERMQNRYEWLMNQVAPALAEFSQYERSRGASEDRIMSFLRKGGIIS